MHVLMRSKYHLTKSLAISYSAVIMLMCHNQLNKDKNFTNKDLTGHQTPFNDKYPAVCIFLTSYPITR